MKVLNPRNTKAELSDEKYQNLVQLGLLCPLS
jgi:hypothetical protein